MADDTREVRVLVREMHASVVGLKPEPCSSLEEDGTTPASDEACGAGSEELDMGRSGSIHHEKARLHVVMAVAGSAAGTFFFPTRV